MTRLQCPLAAKHRVTRFPHGSVFELSEPVMRQWHAIRRADKALLPPADAMMDFLGQERWRYLPVA
jgi:hypothetical protein